MRTLNFKYRRKKSRHVVRLIMSILSILGILITINTAIAYSDISKDTDIGTDVKIANIEATDIAIASDGTSPAINVISDSRLTVDNVYKDRQPAWSSDGQWIIFMTTRYAGWNIAKMRIDGSSITRLTSGLEPSWSPNSRILFSRGPLYYEDVYIMNADGNNIQKLTNTPAFDEYPDWSPDGSKIVYASMGGIANSTPHIWIMNADGSNKYRLNAMGGIQPSWSPDGTKIAFKCYSGGHNICVMNVDGSNLRQLTFNTGNTHEPDWSPDSRYITFSSNKDGDWDIYIVSANGSSQQKLTNNNVVEDNYPAWSRDGRYISYSSNKTGNEEIWIMRIDYSGTIPDATTVTSPDGGENWLRNTTHTITWSSTGTYVKIELLKAGVLNRVISSSTPNDGSYSWTVPNTQTLGSDYKIRITSTTNPIYTDTSNNNFMIGGINVISPNGGENWARNTGHTISWSSLGSPGSYVKIELFKAGVLNRVISSSTPNDGSYYWTVTSTQTTGIDYKIKITSTTNAVYNDFSNNNFIVS